MSCTDNLVDPQHGRKVHVSNRHVLRISCGTKYCRLLSVRAKICHPLQHVSRSATGLAKRLPGPHTRPGELRNGAIESPDQCGDACVPCWNRKSHISNGTAKSVGSHSVSNPRCHGISVDDCAKTENLYSAYEAVLRPSIVLGLKTASYALYRVLCRSQSAVKMPSKVAAGALIFT